jgi:hypothetical protein
MAYQKARCRQDNARRKQEQNADMGWNPQPKERIGWASPELKNGDGHTTSKSRVKH